MSGSDTTPILTVMLVITCLSIRDLYKVHSESTLNEKNKSDTSHNEQVQSMVADNRNAQHLSDYEPRLKTRFTGPHLTFLYCFSCGYKQAFDEFSKIINDRFPAIVIRGQNFSPSYCKASLATLVLYSKMIFMAMVIFGVNPFSFCRLNTPAFYSWLLSNKLYACMMMFFAGNAVETYLISTGAFEISYNEIPVWSKLDVGRFPSPQELVQIIESHNQLSASSFLLPIKPN